MYGLTNYSHHHDNQAYVPPPSTAPPTHMSNRNGTGSLKARQAPRYCHLPVITEDMMTSLRVSVDDTSSSGCSSAGDNMSTVRSHDSSLSGISSAGTLSSSHSPVNGLGQGQEMLMFYYESTIFKSCFLYRHLY